MDIRQAFKICPRCGGKFSAKLKFLKCLSCGLSFYVNPRPANSVILKNDKNEYLFVVRAFKPRKGYLDFPGGFVDENEDFEQSSRREVKEEIGVKVGELKYLSTHHDEYLFQDLNYQVAGITYTGQLPKAAKIKPSDDAAGVEFYKIEDIPLDRLAWKSMHQMIKELKAQLG